MLKYQHTSMKIIPNNEKKGTVYTIRKVSEKTNCKH